MSNKNKDQLNDAEPYLERQPCNWPTICANKAIKQVVVVVVVFKRVTYYYYLPSMRTTDFFDEAAVERRLVVFC